MKTNLNSFIQKYFTRDRWFLICLAALCLCALTCNNSQKNRIIEEKEKEIAFYRDVNGNQHAVIKDLVVSKQQMKDQVDSISKILEIKPKQITRYTKGDLQIDTITGPERIVTRRDTVKGADGRIDTVNAYTYSDSPHLFIDAKPNSFTIKANASITVTDYWKRKRILGLPIGKKEHFVDFGTNNPYITITNASSYKLPPSKKLQLKAGVGIVAGINPFTKQPSLTAGVGIFLTR